jgi:pimeloyl-ACP methyl ester carboxylesterase
MRTTRSSGILILEDRIMLRPLIFLPGTLCDERLWVYQTSFFPSSRVIDLRNQSSIEEMLEDISNTELEKFVLIGFSMGGHVALEFALKYPERVSQVIVMGASGQAYPVHERDVVMRSIPELKKGLFKGITTKRLREFLHPRSFENEDLRLLISSMAGDDACDVYLRQLSATFDRRDLTGLLAKSQIPITFFAGADDKIVPRSVIEESVARIPHTKMRTFSECGHFIPLEKPDEVNDALIEVLRDS